MRHQETDILEEGIEGRVLAVVRGAGSSNEERDTTRGSKRLEKLHLWSIEELIQSQSEDPDIQEIKKTKQQIRGRLAEE